jgi:hypothetical protein
MAWWRGRSSWVDQVGDWSGRGRRGRDSQAVSLLGVSVPDLFSTRWLFWDLVHIDLFDVMIGKKPSQIKILKRPNSCSVRNIFLENWNLNDQKQDLVWLERSDPHPAWTVDLPLARYEWSMVEYGSGMKCMVESKSGTIMNGRILIRHEMYGQINVRPAMNDRIRIRHEINDRYRVRHGTNGRIRIRHDLAMVNIPDRLPDRASLLVPTAGGRRRRRPPPQYTPPSSPKRIYTVTLQ